MDTITNKKISKRIVKKIKLFLTKQIKNEIKSIS